MGVKINLKTNLAILRRRKGLKQKQLAEFLAIRNTTYSAYERGNSEPPIKTLCRLADFYGVSLDTLIRAEELPSPNHMPPSEKPSN